MIYQFEGSKYQTTRNLTTSETAKLIRQEINEKYSKKDGWKISVRTKLFAGGSSIDVWVVDTKIKVFQDDYAKLEIAKDWEGIRSIRWENQGYTEEFNKVLKDLEAIVNQYNYDDSDSMTDYFNVGFYSSVGIDWEAKKDLLNLN